MQIFIAFFLEKHFYFTFFSFITKMEILMHSYLYQFQYCHVHVSFYLESLPTRVRTVLAIEAVLSQSHFFFLSRIMEI